MTHPFTAGLLFLGLCIAAGPLALYRIYLDPGHGGIQGTGAVGPGGTTEADVNWEVADRLRQLLEADGAAVRLSHAEKHIQEMQYWDAPLDAARWGADVYISIHHNADAALRSGVSWTEVFYHVQDDGASADLAREVFTELDAWMRLPNSRVKSCYAYAVLRNATMPAVLGEACHISHPASETLLSTTDSWWAEAGAYHRAIVRWLGRGLPRAKTLDVTEDNNRLHIDARLDVPGGLDPASVVVSVDENVLEHVQCLPLVQAIVAHTAGPVAPGTHTVALRFRSLSGNAAQVVRRRVFVPFRPAKCDISFHPETTSPPGEGYRRLAVVVRDRHGFAAPPGTPVVLSYHAPDGSRTTHTLQPHGELWSLPWTGPVMGSCRVHIGTGTGESVFPIEWPAHAHGKTSPGAWGYVRSAHDGRAVARAVATQGHQEMTGIASAEDGWFEIPFSATSGRMLTWSAPGYYTRTVELPQDSDDRELDIRLDPWFGGVLLGESVVLDASGGADTVGLANLAVARYLRDYLALAGARPVLIRDGDDPLGADTRIARALAVQDATCVVLVTHDAPRVHAGELAGLSASRGLRRWSDGESLARALAEACQAHLGTATADTLNWDDWLVMHGHRGFRAVAISPVLLSGEVTRQQLLSPLENRRKAQAIFHGLVHWMAEEKREMHRLAPLHTVVIELETMDGGPPEGAVAILDEALVVASDTTGRCVARFLTPGSHTLRVESRHGGIGAHAIRLDQPETLLRYRLVQDSP